MKSKEKKNSYCINLIITAIIIFSANLWPSCGVITEYGSTICGIFIGVIYGYCTLGMIVPSFMALLALGFSGYASVPEIMKMSFGDSTVLYIVSILILSAMLEQSGLSEKIVHWLISRKFIKGRPWLLSFMFLLAAYVVALFVNSIPSTIICWALLFDLFPTLGYKGGDKWPIMMIFGVLYTSTLGGCVPSYQISIASNFGLLGVVSQGAFTLAPLQYMMWAFCCSAILFAGYMLLARYVIRPDMTLLQNADFSWERNNSLSREQKFVAVLFVVFIAGLILPFVLPESWWIKSVLDNMSSCGWGLLVVLLAISIKIRGEAFFEFGSIFSKGVIWDIVLMIATIYTLVGAITDEATGVSQLIISFVAPWRDMMGDVVFLVLVALLYSLIANLTNTVAASFIFIPMVYVLTAGTIYAYIFTAMTVFISNVSFLMPSATVNAAMMYNQKEWMPFKTCLLLALFALISVYVVMIVIGVPLGNIIFS